MNVKAFSRTDRIGTELRRELAQLLRDQVRDPRLANITVHEVRVTRDLAHAKVFFTCFSSGEDKSSFEKLEGIGEISESSEFKAQEKLLNGRLAGFLRHALAQTVQLRTIPQLHFVFDTSIGYGERLSALIDASNPIQEGLE